MLRTIALALAILFPMTAQAGDLRARFGDGTVLTLHEAKCADKDVAKFIRDVFQRTPKEQIPPGETPDTVYARMLSAEVVEDPTKSAVTRGCWTLRPDMQVLFVTKGRHAVLPPEIFAPVDKKKYM